MNLSHSLLAAAKRYAFSQITHPEAGSLSNLTGSFLATAPRRDFADRSGRQLPLEARSSNRVGTPVAGASVGAGDSTGPR